MNLVALKMLVGDRAKYLGIVMGLTFASMLVTQQAAIFLGLMTQTYSYVDDTAGARADIWVMDPEVEFTEDQKRMLETELYRVRGIEGVAWAAPVSRAVLNVRLPSGRQRGCTIIGLDDSTLIGGPPQMVQGRLEDLRRADAVIVEAKEAAERLAHPPIVPGGKPTPLRVGDVLEINEHRAVVVGLCSVKPGFFWSPAVYTLYSRAKVYSPMDRRTLSFILVKAAPGQDVSQLIDRIKRQTKLAAYTNDGFRKLTSDYVIDSTGIAINFGIAVLLGFIVGTVIAGQTFYNFTLENARHFAALKAMGAADATLLRMIVLQSLTTGAIGYGLGVGVAALFGYLSRGGKLAFLLPWQLLAASAVAVLAICCASAALGVVKVLRLEPGIVFK